jgi:DNA invertase Pin-like site-specific DNA recombinase
LNELVCIAEFESELRAERQREGIEKAKENNVKFGRPQKTDEAH